MRHVASWAPGFAIVTHVGRTSGRTYRTPVNVFRDDGRYVFALTYGRQSDWVLNVLATGGCEIETRRKKLRLEDPVVFTDRTRQRVAQPARWVLGALRVDNFLALRAPGD
jgi:deazaflavin-dependent oxidoreductase (nitroreductase family)